VSPDHARNVASYDVVLELVGAPNLARDLASLGPDGEIAVIGVAGGTEDCDLPVLMTRRAVIRGSTRRARSAEEKADVVRGVAEDVIPLIAGRRL
jgi:NADPH:quinone reductase-like Zn-dependent oxidoreductase